MKKIMITVAMIVFLVVAGSSWAYQITINRYDGYYSGLGGEFNITNTPNSGSNLPISGYASSALVGGGFETFCLEYTEYVNMGSSYYAEISSTNSATKENDMISQGTAYLYSQFAQGTLSGYNYGAGRSSSAAALQNTIWWLEGEIGGLMPTTFLSALQTQFQTTNQATFQANYNPAQSNYGVGVLNLYTSAAKTGNAQDQLVRTTSVPEPATMLLLGLGLIGLAGVRSRMKK